MCKVQKNTESIRTMCKVQKNTESIDPKKTRSKRIIK